MTDSWDALRFDRAEWSGGHAVMAADPKPFRSNLPERHTLQRKLFSTSFSSPLSHGLPSGFFHFGVADASVSLSPGWGRASEHHVAAYRRTTVRLHARLAGTSISFAPISGYGRGIAGLGF